MLSAELNHFVQELLLLVAARLASVQDGGSGVHRGRGPPDEKNRKELLLLSPSVLVPRLTHGVVTVWDTLAIAEYMHEWNPQAGLLPTIRLRAPTAAPSPAKCIPASRTCARPCR